MADRHSGLSIRTASVSERTRTSEVRSLTLAVGSKGARP